jgi:hypothetical protein
LVYPKLTLYWPVLAGSIKLRYTNYPLAEQLGQARIVKPPSSAGSFEEIADALRVQKKTLSTI